MSWGAAELERSPPLRSALCIPDQLLVDNVTYDHCMTSYKQRQPAGRHIPRPKSVEPCPHCSAVFGLNYHDCPSCHQAIEGIWEADWKAFLAREQIVASSDDEILLAPLVIAELDEHPWTIVDMAMYRIRCEACQHELGGGPRTCVLHASSRLAICGGTISMLVTRAS